MATRKDFYSILEVSSSASAEEIKAAYRKLASKYHPDKHKGNPLEDLAEEKLKDINEAYEVLGNPEIRHKYDNGEPVNNGYYNESEAPNYIYYLNMINECLEKGQWQQGIAYADQAKAVDAGRWEAFYLKGYALIKIGNVALARAELESALGKGMDDPVCKTQYGYVLMELGEFSHAATIYDQIIKAAGEIPDVLAALAICCEHTGQNPRAEAIWSRLRAIDPNNSMLRERSQFVNMGGKYVDKSDAVVGSCCLCSLLSCLCDCM